MNAATTCALCPTELTDQTRSEEHVILNAIGGRMLVDDFICKRCNDTTGHAWDAQLAAQLNGLSIFCAITRDRGAPPPHRTITTEGEALAVHPDGYMTLAAPRFEETQVDGRVQVSFTARTLAEARKMLRGVKAKYPKTDTAALEADLKVETYYPRGYLKETFSIDGATAGRSIVKSALALAVHAGIAARDCQDALDYLLGSGGEPCFGYYYEDDPVEGRPEGMPLHCVSVSADPAERLVLGYVEFFGIYRMVVCLGRDYTGPAMCLTYAVDPRSGETLDLKVRLKVGLNDIGPIYAYERIPEGSMEAAFRAVIAEAYRRNQERAQTRAITTAFASALETMGLHQGDELSDEQVQQFAAIMTDNLTPYLEQLVATRLRPRPPAPREADAEAETTE